MTQVEKIRSLEINFQQNLGKDATPFIESLYEIDRTIFGRKLINNSPVFSIKLSPDVYHPHIRSEKADIIYYPTAYNFHDSVTLLTSFSHEIQHLVQKKNKLLLKTHKKKGSLEDFFIQEKLTEAQAEVTSSLVLRELAQINGRVFLKKKDEEEYYKRQGALMIRNMMYEKSEWQEVYDHLAISHIAFLALTCPERITKESQKRFHEAVLSKYAQQYSPFVEKKDLDIIDDTAREEIHTLKKIISQKNFFLLKQYLLRKEREVASF